MDQGKIVSVVDELSDKFHAHMRIVKSVDELPEDDIARKRIEKVIFLIRRMLKMPVSLYSMR